MTKKLYDVLIIGGGAAGLFCAHKAVQKGLRVALIEQKDLLATKLRLAGGGMGNMTNRNINHDTCGNIHTFGKDFNEHISKQYRSHNPREMAFLVDDLFKDFMCDDVITLLNAFNIPYEEREIGQIFCLKPVKFFVEALEKECKRVDFYTELVKQVYYEKKGDDMSYHITLEEQHLYAKNLVVATGSNAYPQIGASDFGTRLAKKWGIHYHEFYPALVPFSLKGNIDLEGLEGISVQASLTVQHGKKSYTDPHYARSLLFTHKGISGPAVLVASCYLPKAEQLKEVNISINFLPNSNLIALMHEPPNGKKILKNLLLPLLPDRLVYRLMPKDLENRKVAEIGKKDRERLITNFYKAIFTVEKTDSLKKAEAALGGVSLKELNQNMEAKQYKGLYFCGEVVDVTGLLGGYNIHFAFASAIRVANSL